jgi:hypothetical protein
MSTLKDGDDACLDQCPRIKDVTELGFKGLWD